MLTSSSSRRAAAAHANLRSGRCRRPASAAAGPSAMTWCRGSSPGHPAPVAQARRSAARSCSVCRRLNLFILVRAPRSAALMSSAANATAAAIRSSSRISARTRTAACTRGAGVCAHRRSVSGEAGRQRLLARPQGTGPRALRQRLRRWRGARRANCVTRTPGRGLLVPARRPSCAGPVLGGCGPSGVVHGAAESSLVLVISEGQRSGKIGAAITRGESGLLRTA